MENFTPISAAIGGTFIGLSAVFLLWSIGRIAGVSGIFHGLITPIFSEFLWRFLFILGLILGSAIYYLIPVIHFIPRMHYPIWLLLLAGILVSIGTRLGGGCTSGHGVCGLARLSKRSLVATMIFLITGFFATFIVRHIGHF